MNHIHKEDTGFSVYEDSIDIKGFVKTKNIKISEIASVETNNLFRALNITTKDKKKYTVKFKLKEYLKASANYLQGKSDVSEYKETIKSLDAQKEELRSKDKKRKLYWTLGIIGFFVLLIAMGSSDDSNSGSSNNTVVEQETPSVPDESEANIMAEGFVKQILKAPSTADFPFLDYTTTIDGSRYTVSSYVDSQNSFGAMIRSNWRVVMDHNGGEWNNPYSWDLVELWFDGEQVFPGI